jgi:hypothetical protein
VASWILSGDFGIGAEVSQWRPLDGVGDLVLDKRCGEKKILLGIYKIWQ